MNAQGVAQKTLDIAQEGKKQVQTFRKTVEGKADQESKRSGWKSDVFDCMALMSNRRNCHIIRIVSFHWLLASICAS